MQKSTHLGYKSRLLGKGGRGKGGLLNRYPVARVGWTWKGTGRNGRNMFSVRFGDRRWSRRLHYHLVKGV
jgi:hypothetical protein